MCALIVQVFDNEYPMCVLIVQVVALVQCVALCCRINENSKVLIVDGNVGVGKEAFAARIAKNFDMRLFPSTPDLTCFTGQDSPFDIRSLDHLLPPSLRSYDLTRFLAESTPEAGQVSRLQWPWYIQKFLTYLSALEHLMHTGERQLAPPLALPLDPPLCLSLCYPSHWSHHWLHH